MNRVVILINFIIDVYVILIWSYPYLHAVDIVIILTTIGSIIVIILLLQGPQLNVVTNINISVVIMILLL